MDNKTKNTLKVGDIITCSNKIADNAIFINNHVTPYFGKLLHEGRKAIKNGDIHSCWLNSFGCQLKIETGSTQRNYRSIDELNKLISEAKVNKSNQSKRSAPDERSPTENKNKSRK